LPKQLLILNEAHSFRTREKMNKLKPYLAAPPDWLIVNKKNVPQYEVPNIVNLILFSNHEDAIAPTQDDRRYFVCRCRITEKPPKEHFDEFYAWLNSGGDAKFFGWLLARDISRFDHRAPPPMTAAKQAMIDLAKPRDVRWCLEQLRDDGRFEDRQIVAAWELVQLAERSRNSASRDVTDKSALKALKEEGFIRLGQVGGRKNRQRLWARDPAGLISQLPRIRF
jgi:hypothetical protein